MSDDYSVPLWISRTVHDSGVAVHSYENRYAANADDFRHARCLYQQRPLLIKDTSAAFAQLTVSLPVTTSFTPCMRVTFPLYHRHLPPVSTSPSTRINVTFHKNLIGILYLSFTRIVSLKSGSPEPSRVFSLSLIESKITPAIHNFQICALLFAQLNVFLKFNVCFWNMRCDSNCNFLVNISNIDVLG